MKAHIADFGGDPERVTILGQSAGGSSVIDLVASPKAAGLFSRAVSMSGGAGTIKTPQEGEATAGELIQLPLMLGVISNTLCQVLLLLNTVRASTGRSGLLVCKIFRRRRYSR